MSIRVKDESGRPVEIQPAIAVNREGGLSNIVTNAMLTGDFGRALFLQYSGAGFEVWYSSYQPQFDTILLAEHNAAVLELHMALVNQIEGEWEGVPNASLPQHFCELSFAPHINTRARFRGGLIYETCDIHFERWFLYDLASSFPLLAEFLERVDKGVPTDLTTHHFYCNADMMNAIRFIRQRHHTDRRLKFVLELKVKEILIHALERAEAGVLYRPTLHLKPTDIDKLLEAKRIIESELDMMPSLKELSRKTLLNEFKLKRGFKMVFGHTMSEHHMREKFKEAKLRLEATDQPISQIALEAGYAFDNNFSAEFKRRTGFSPLDYRMIHKGGKG